MAQMTEETEIVVIGAGITGITAAYYLLKEGKDVVVIEKNEVASEASGANAGFACRPSLLNPTLLEISKVALQEYQHLGQELKYDIEYETCGFLVLLEDRDSLKEWTHQVEERHKLGLGEVGILDPEEVHGLEPHVVRPEFGGYYDPLSGHINPLHLVPGLAERLTELGGKVYERTEVLEIKTKNQRVESVITNKGQIKANYIINACGAYAGSIGRMVGIEIPVKPHRHHMLVTEALPPLVHCVVEGGAYRQAEVASASAAGDSKAAARTGAAIINQQKKGNLLLGITGDFAGYNKLTTFDDICTISEMATKYVPLLKDLHVSIIRTWANHYPSTTDYLPILGAVDGIEGFVIATGLNDYGLEVGAGIGKVVSELVCFGETTIPIETFSLSRFH
jgi:glycine/D-amino acid oxidase-like deaminating enzyme